MGTFVYTSEFINKFKSIYLNEDYKDSAFSIEVKLAYTGTDYIHLDENFLFETAEDMIKWIGYELMVKGDFLSEAFIMGSAYTSDHVYKQLVYKIVTHTKVYIPPFTLPTPINLNWSEIEYILTINTLNRSDLIDPKYTEKYWERKE